MKRRTQNVECGTWNAEPRARPLNFAGFDKVEYPPSPRHVGLRKGYSPHLAKRGEENKKTPIVAAGRLA